MQVGTGLPAVVAVVATTGGPEEIAPALEGLAAQEYGNLTVVVLDASAEQATTEKIAELLPGAFVREVFSAPSFGAVCNTVLGTVEGATFLLFCHDDTQLEPGAVHALVTEAFRANAGIVGAKLVRAEDPERLDEMGYGVDAFGFTVPLIEAGELDQSQHDASRDVFMVSTAAMLVRADLFGDLGGFTPAMTPAGEALDLCWRARVAGASVAVMPAAVARHARDSSLADSSADDRRKEVRDQARVVLTTYGPGHLLRVAPLAALLSVADLVTSTCFGHVGRSLDIIRAWGWNLLHLPSALSRRRKVQASRRVPDGDIRAAQIRGSGRIVTSYRNLRAATSRRIPDAIAAARDLPSTLQHESVLAGAVLAVILAAVFAIGSRGLLTHGVPVLRDFLPVGPPGALLREWWGGWRQEGFVVNGAAPGVLAVLGVGHFALLGGGGPARTLVLLAGLPLGALGAWRCGRDILSPRARLAATMAYVVVAVPYDAIASGRWVALVSYGVAPWILAHLARASGVAPFASSRPFHEGVVTGLIVAIAATVSAVGFVITLGMAVLIGALLALSGDVAGARRVARSGGIAIGVGFLCSLPTSLDLLARSDRWSVLWGPNDSRRPHLDELLRLSVGGDGDTLLWAAVPVVAVLVMVVGRGWRFRWGAISWSVAIAAWGAALLSYRCWPDGVRPGSGVLLAPAAAALAFAVGLGVESFHADVRGGAFGWRQAAASVVALVAAVAVVPFLQAAIDGRWGLVDGDVVAAVATLEEADDSNYRTLWLGDSDVLPMRSVPLEEGLAFAVTRGVRPGLGSVHPPRRSRAADALADTVRSALSGGQSRLGSQLVDHGVRYVVVVSSLSAGSLSDSSPMLDATRSTLAQQLDLHSLDVAPGVDVYRVADGRVTDPALGRTRRAPGSRIALNVIQLIALVAAIRAAKGRAHARSTPDAEVQR
ncbi:MAG: glycosyltransferase [Microthrixaceae bacterium]|nr:glycosyltransferase [Microthrixaceae bacterium]